MSESIGQNIQQDSAEQLVAASRELYDLMDSRLQADTSSPLAYRTNRVVFGEPAAGSEEVMKAWLTRTHERFDKGAVSLVVGKARPEYSPHGYAFMLTLSPEGEWLREHPGVSYVGEHIAKPQDIPVERKLRMLTDFQKIVELIPVGRGTGV